MIGKAETEEFIRRAEELNANLGSTALVGSEKFLDARQWLISCENSTRFYIKFYNQVEASLEFMLAHPGDARPVLLDFLAAHELEKGFAPMELRVGAFSSVSAAYGHMTATARYMLARMLTKLLSGEPVSYELKTQAEAAFAALWTLLAGADAEDKQRWQAYEAILIVASGVHDRCIEVYEREYRFDMTKHENSHRTVIKTCYLLSRIATGRTDGDVAFAATSYINILKLDYYLWRVNDDAAAEMALVPLVLLCHLYEKIMKGGVPSQQDLFASLAPRAVVETLESLRRA